MAFRLFSEVVFNLAFLLVDFLWYKKMNGKGSLATYKYFCPVKKYWEKLKQKWNIDSDQRMIKIWVIFAITGSFTVFVRKSLFKVLGIHIDAKWLAFLVKLVAIYFIYQLLLFLIGSILGESKFFGWFIKKMNYRFIGKKVEN